MAVGRNTEQAGWKRRCSQTQPSTFLQKSVLAPSYIYCYAHSQHLHRRPTEFPWVEVSDDSGGMLYSLRRKHNHRPKKVLVGRAIWVDLPCKNLTRQSLVSHGKSQSHTLAMRMEAELASSRKDGGIAMALDKVISAERKAFIGALKCMYFLTN